MRSECHRVLTTEPPTRTQTPTHTQHATCVIDWSVRWKEEVGPYRHIKDFMEVINMHMQTRHAVNAQTQVTPVHRSDTCSHFCFSLAHTLSDRHTHCAIAPGELFCNANELPLQLLSQIWEATWQRLVNASLTYKARGGGCLLSSCLNTAWIKTHNAMTEKTDILK